MSTQTTDPSTAWLGEYAADLTPEQVDSLNHLRAELTGPGVSTASTIRVLLEDAADYAEHTRTQRAAAHVPHPTGAVGVVEDWQEWDDGTIRRSYDCETGRTRGRPSTRCSRRLSACGLGPARFWTRHRCDSSASRSTSPTSHPLRRVEWRSSLLRQPTRWKRYRATERPLRAPYSDERPRPSVMRVGPFRVGPLRGRARAGAGESLGVGCTGARFASDVGTAGCAAGPPTPLTGPLRCRGISRRAGQDG